MKRQLVRSGLRYAACASLVLLVIPLSASADTFGNGPPEEGYQADGTNHTYCFGGQFNSGLWDAADHAMQNSIGASTDMTQQKFSNCDDPATDVKWTDANLDGTARGAYGCLTPSTISPGDICYAAIIILDPDQINQGDNDLEDRKKTACHEAGHSVGLQHGDGKTDCMINGEIPSTSSVYRYYNDHHVNDHINPTY